MTSNAAQLLRRLYGTARRDHSRSISNTWIEFPLFNIKFSSIFQKVPRNLFVSNCRMRRPHGALTFQTFRVIFPFLLSKFAKFESQKLTLIGMWSCFYWQQLDNYRTRGPRWIWRVSLDRTDQENVSKIKIIQKLVIFQRESVAVVIKRYSQ